MIITALVCVAFIAVVGFIEWDRHEMCTAQVEGSLRKHHATDIQIKLDWFDYDRDTLTYDVEYRDRNGKFHRNRCKVTSGGYPADERVYWTDPVGPPG